MLRNLSLILLILLVGIVVVIDTNALCSIVLRPPSADVQNELGLIFIQEQEIEKAITAFRFAIMLDPDVAEYHFNLAFVYSNSPDAAFQATGYTKPQLFNEIQKESRTARRLKPEDFEIAYSYATNFQLSDVFQAMLDREEVTEAWEYCLALQRKQYVLNPRPWMKAMEVSLLLRLARLEQRQGHSAEARTHLKQVLAVSTESTGELDVLASCNLEETQ